MILKLRYLIDYIIVIVSFFSMFFCLLNFELFYNKIIYRGYVETEMWLIRLSHGEYAREYYILLNFIKQCLDLSTFESAMLLSTVCFILSSYIFKFWKSRKNLVFYLIVFNVFSLLLFFSPGRTSLTILIILIIFVNIYPKINPISLLISIAAMAWLHAATLIVVFTIVCYDYIQKSIRTKFSDIRVVFLLKATSIIMYSIVLSFVFNSGVSYVDVVDGAGNLLNITLLLLVGFSVFYYADKDIFFLYMVLFFMLVFIVGMNASYIYRIIFFPMVLGIFYKQLKDENNTF